MASTRAIVISLLVAVASIPFVGCGEPDPAPATESNVAANVETTVKPEWSPPLTGGTCPEPSLGSTMPTEWYQARATSVLKYLVGGKDPIRSEEIIANAECKAAHECTQHLHDMILDGKSGATLQAATSGTVCGLKAALYKVDFGAEVNATTWAEMRACGTHLDGCWGVGVSGFYYADPSQDRVRRIYIDPEPARLTSDLTGSTGATAAAVYTNTGTGTSVLKWPGSYISSLSPPVAGTPCSTTDLLAGVDTLKVIQGVGASYRRCY